MSYEYTSKLIRGLMKMPDDQFELVLDIFRVYGTNTAAGIVTAVAEMRLAIKEEDEAHARGG